MTAADFRWVSLWPMVVSSSVPFKVVIELNLEFLPLQNHADLWVCVCGGD